MVKFEKYNIAKISANGTVITINVNGLKFLEIKDYQNGENKHDLIICVYRKCTK